jgi:hypothetical protein
MPQNKLNLKQIAESVVKYIRKLPTEKEFGIIEIKIQDGKPHQMTVEESKLAKDIR